MGTVSTLRAEEDLNVHSSMPSKTFYSDFYWISFLLDYHLTNHLTNPHIRVSMRPDKQRIDTKPHNYKPRPSL